MKRHHSLAAFAFGVILPFRSANLILRTPRLMAISLAPAIFTAVLYALLFAPSLAWTQAQAGRAITALGILPGTWLATVIVALAAIMLLIAAATAFSVFAAILALPFCDYLAESAEGYIMPVLSPVPRSNWQTWLKRLGIDLVKSFFAAALAIGALLLSWIPGMQPVAIALGTLLMTLQFVSYARTRRDHDLRSDLSFCRQNFAACAGFGLVTLALFTVPLASIWMLPISVVGGTWLVGRFERGNRQDLPV